MELPSGEPAVLIPLLGTLQQHIPSHPTPILGPHRMERDLRPASFSQSLLQQVPGTKPFSHLPEKEKCYFMFLDSRRWACCQNHWYSTAPSQEAASSCQGKCSADRGMCCPGLPSGFWQGYQWWAFQSDFPKLLLWGVNWEKDSHSVQRHPLNSHLKMSLDVIQH